MGTHPPPRRPPRRPRPSTPAPPPPTFPPLHPRPSRPSAPAAPSPSTPAPPSPSLVAAGHDVPGPLLPPGPVCQRGPPRAAQRDARQPRRPGRGRAGRVGAGARLFRRPGAPRAPGPARRPGGLPPAVRADCLLWRAQRGVWGRAGGGRGLGAGVAGTGGPGWRPWACPWRHGARPHTHPHEPHAPTRPPTPTHPLPPPPSRSCGTTWGTKSRWARCPKRARTSCWTTSRPPSARAWPPS